MKILMDNSVYELKLFSFLFVGDAVLFANTPEVLSMLNGVYAYCNMWNLCVNIKKSWFLRRKDIQLVISYMIM